MLIICFIAQSNDGISVHLLLLSYDPLVQSDLQNLSFNYNRHYKYLMDEHKKGTINI